MSDYKHTIEEGRIIDDCLTYSNGEVFVVQDYTPHDKYLNVFYISLRTLEQCYEWADGDTVCIWRRKENNSTQSK